MTRKSRVWVKVSIPRAGEFLVAVPVVVSRYDDASAVLSRATEIARRRVRVTPAPGVTTRSIKARLARMRWP